MNTDDIIAALFYSIHTHPPIQCVILCIKQHILHRSKTGDKFDLTVLVQAFSMDRSSSKEASTIRPNEKDLVEVRNRPLPEMYILPTTVPSNLRAILYPFNLYCYAKWTKHDRINRITTPTGESSTPCDHGTSR